MKPTINNKKQTKVLRGPGFTLIELLVVISILALLSTVVIAGFSQNNRVKAVVLGTDLVISSVRSAQNGSLIRERYQVLPVCRMASQMNFI